MEFALSFYKGEILNFKILKLKIFHSAQLFNSNEFVSDTWMLKNMAMQFHLFSNSTQESGSTGRFYIYFYCFV